MRKLVAVAAVAVLVALVGPRSALAQAADDVTRNAARSLGAAGVESYQAGDYAAAADKLDKAYRVLKVPTLGLWSARALAKQDLMVEAAERYQEVQRLAAVGDTQVQTKAKAEAAAELDELTARIPQLVINLENARPDDVTVTIDDIPVVTALLGEKRPVNPGQHRVAAKRGEELVERSVEVKAGQTAPVVLTFAPRPEATTNPSSSATGATEAPVGASSDAPRSGSLRRTVGFVVLGVGGAGVAFGGIATALASGKKDDIDQNPNCRDNNCLRSESVLVDSYTQWRTLSRVGFIAGGVLAATGVILVITAPRGGDVALRLGPGDVSVSRRF